MIKTSHKLEIQYFFPYEILAKKVLNQNLLLIIKYSMPFCLISEIIHPR